MYHFGLEPELVVAEQRLRLERSRHRALLVEARQAHPPGRRYPSLGAAQLSLRTAAGLLRATSASLAALADALERPVARQALERAR